MTSNKFEEISNLHNESIRITEFFNKKLPDIKKQYADPHNSLDKHYDGFIEGDAIQSWNMRVCYRSFSGYNGVSSTYSDFHPDRKIITEYFLKYLNNHTEEIFNEIAQMMLEDARKMKADAIKESEEMKAELESL
jgi:hypothetical protein